MQTLSRFQEMALQVALRELFAKPYFDITTLDALLTTANRAQYKSTPTYGTLRVLHCVHWGKMGEELAVEVRSQILALMGVPEFVQEVPPETSKAKPGLFDRLVGR